MPEPPSCKLSMFYIKTTARTGPRSPRRTLQQRAGHGNRSSNLFDSLEREPFPNLDLRHDARDSEPAEEPKSSAVCTLHTYASYSRNKMQKIQRSNIIVNVIQVSRRECRNFNMYIPYSNLLITLFILLLIVLCLSDRFKDLAAFDFERNLESPKSVIRNAQSSAS